MNTEVPVPVVSHVRPGSEMIFGPQGPIGYRQSEHIPMMPIQAIGYADIASIVGLSADTEPKTVKRAALDWMGLPRPREKVFGVMDKSSIQHFACQILATGSKIIWVPVDGKSGGHIPKSLDLNGLPADGQVRVMEQAYSHDRRPFRISLAREPNGVCEVDIEYGNIGGETGRTFESYKYKTDEVNPQDSITWSQRLCLDRQLGDVLRLSLPLVDFTSEANERLVLDMLNACKSMQQLSEKLSSQHSGEQLPPIIGVEGYIRPDGACIFVDTDFPSVDGPRWYK